MHISKITSTKMNSYKFYTKGNRKKSIDFCEQNKLQQYWYTDSVYSTIGYNIFEKIAGHILIFLSLAISDQHID